MHLLFNEYWLVLSIELHEVVNDGRYQVKNTKPDILIKYIAPISSFFHF